MERVAWTDRRLDDLSRQMDAGFARVDRELRQLRAEMRGEFTAVRNEIAELRALIIRGGGALMIVLLGTVFANGV
jgi:hypothetical protein